MASAIYVRYGQCHISEVNDFDIFSLTSEHHGLHPDVTWNLESVTSQHTTTVFVKVR